jgi:arsenate reductase
VKAGEEPVPRILFVCTHNSARSQMAEAYLRKLGRDLFEAESAGLEPGKLNPYVVRALLEDGIDITGKQTNDVFEFFKQGRLYDYVITVCSKEAAERCPIFPGRARRLQWFFPDPSTFAGSDEEIMIKVRDVRDSIRAQVKVFIEELKSGR